MKKTIKTIKKYSNNFMLGHVTLNKKNINSFKIKNINKSSLFFKLPPYLNSLFKKKSKKKVYKIIHVFNVINASLQFSFFLGNSSIRVDNIDSSWIVNMLDKVFKKSKIENVHNIYHLKESIVKILIKSNIPLLNKRIISIEEIFNKLDFIEYGNSYLNINHSICMLKQLVSFKQDIFFKKGLFAILISSRMMPELKKINKSYKKELFLLPVPADYQIPKVLRYFKLINLSDDFLNIIESNTIIPENSNMELNLRAATIKACNKIAKNNNISVDDVDSYLFMIRKKIDLQHHLCITSNY